MRNGTCHCPIRLEYSMKLGFQIHGWKNLNLVKEKEVGRRERWVLVVNGARFIWSLIAGGGEG
jgi:hypothetical protein